MSCGCNISAGLSSLSQSVLPLCWMPCACSAAPVWQGAHRITVRGSCGCASAAGCWARASWPLPASWPRASLAACPDPAWASTTLQQASACSVQDQPCQRHAPSVSAVGGMLLRASVVIGLAPVYPSCMCSDIISRALPECSGIVSVLPQGQIGISRNFSQRDH